MNSVTPLAEQLKHSALTLAAASQRDDALLPLRQRAESQLKALSFPEKRQEAWKYTTLTALRAGQLTTMATPLVDNTAAHSGSVPALADNVILITNGQLPAMLPALPPGVTAAPLSHSETDSNVPDTPFGWLNGASLSDGLLLTTAPNQKINRAIHVVFFNQAETPCHAANRLHVALADGSELTLIEHYLGSGPVLANAVTQIRAGANSHLTHYRLQSEAADTLHIGNLQIDQLRDSRVDSSQLMCGNTLRRNDVHVRLLEQGAQLAMRGVFIARDSSHIDNQVRVEHVAAHCHSEQVYKGIAGEQGRAVFNGHIHIHPHASGSDAALSNNNMLLSNGAEIDSKPVLEIYNDDVKCAHGTTMGQMNESQLFYLRSRGIDTATAKRMLGTGFVNATLMAMPDSTLQDWAMHWLGEAL